MATLTVIDEKDAPVASPKASQINKRMKEFEGYVDELSAKGAGYVGSLKVAPADGTLKAVGMRISRAATRMGVEVETWNDEKETVYFELK